MACLVVAAFGFSLATQFRSQTIYEQTCPNGNCETIVKEYEYLPIEDDYSEDQKPTIDKDAAVVDSMTGIVGENAETENAETTEGETDGEEVEVVDGEVIETISITANEDVLYIGGKLWQLTADDVRAIKEVLGL